MKCPSIRSAATRLWLKARSRQAQVCEERSGRAARHFQQVESRDSKFPRGAALFVAMDGGGGERGKANGDVFRALRLRRCLGSTPFPGAATIACPARSLNVERPAGACSKRGACPATRRLSCLELRALSRALPSRSARPCAPRSRSNGPMFTSPREFFDAVSGLLLRRRRC